MVRANMQLVLLLTVGLFATALADVPRCPGIKQTAVVLGYNFSNCNDNGSCIYKRGEKIEGKLRFRTTKDAVKLKLELSARIGPFEIKLPGFNTDGCANQNYTCPLKRNETYEVTIRASIPNFAATGVFKNKMSLRDQDSEYLFCFIVKARIN